MSYDGIWFDSKKIEQCEREGGEKIIRAINLLRELEKDTKSLSSFINQDSLDKVEVVRRATESALWPDRLELALKLIASVKPSLANVSKREAEIEKIRKLAAEFRDVSNEYVMFPRNKEEHARKLHRRMSKLMEKLTDKIHTTKQSLVFEREPKVSSRWH